MMLRAIGDRSTWRVELAIAVFLVAFPWVFPVIGGYANLATRILILGLFGIGMDLIFGYTGMLSFGQAAFYGTGGFVTAYLLSTGMLHNTLGALALGTIAAACCGMIIGYLCLRQSGVYFAMLTLAFGEVFYFLENSPLAKWTGGENGLPGLPKPIIPLGFTTLHVQSNLALYYFVAVLFFVGYWVARRIVRSPMGAVLRAILENPARAAAVGHNVPKYKLAVFTIAAAYAGIAGGLLGIFQGYMPPDAFSIDQSGEIIIMTIIGGAGTLIGPLVGAGLWSYLREALQNLHGVGAFWKLILGLLFIVLVTLFRRGITGGITDSIGLFRLRRRTAAAHVEEAPAVTGEVQP